MTTQSVKSIMFGYTSNYPTMSTCTACHKENLTARMKEHGEFVGICRDCRNGERDMTTQTAAHIHFDSTYAPCCFLIVRDGCDYKDESNSILIQLESDQVAVAESIGWNDASGQEWYDFLRDIEGESFPALLDYFQD